MAPFEERVARNEALFRAVNEELQSLTTRLSLQPTGETPFVCECGNGDCAELVDVPPAVYERVRADARRFVVLPGHVMPEIERVLEQTSVYAIVEKDTPTAARIAEQHDPRA